MQSAITRLALFQFLTVIYCILGMGVILKVRYNGVAPPLFATYLRDYGFLLLILPAVWILWASVSGNRPLVGTGEAGSILISGLVLMGFLVLLAFVGTMSACSRQSIHDSPASYSSPP